ncbi:hypothetical protein [Microvirga pakistanensis]|uniref:hypothetical protein n=1 Tax=Microvirga pakistanensis TaxID=1682650 RepID=UPI001FCE6EAF|nr:hypothetical protein [Microvirga pakistanensis]
MRPRRDLRNRFLGVSQFGGPLQPQALDGGRDRFAETGVIDPTPVIGRQAGDLGKIIDPEVFIQMIMDVGRNAREALWVAFRNRFFHRPPSIELFRPILSGRFDKSCGFRAGSRPTLSAPTG